MRTIPIARPGFAVGAVAILLAGCGSSDAASDDGRPQIVVTTDILGDIVGEVVGDLASVEVIMPSGASPHDFQPSARQAETMENADLLITNGAGFEAGMTSLIDSVTADGTSMFAFADAVDLRSMDDDDHDDEDEDHDEDHEDEGHDDDDDHEDEDHDGEDKDHDEDEDHGDEDHDEDEDHGDEDHDDDHGHGSEDPHLWTDPQRIVTALAALEPVIAGLDGVDADTLAAQTDDYLGELATLNSDMDETLSVIASDDRVLITNHEVFGYFAERFDFRVAGAIIPALTTNAEASAAGIDDLITLIDAEGVPAIFVESTQSTALADAIADDSDTEVAVVQLFSESLGAADSGADTYLSMMRTNASLIASSLST